MRITVAGLASGAKQPALPPSLSGDAPTWVIAGYDLTEGLDQKCKPTMSWQKLEQTPLHSQHPLCIFSRRDDSRRNCGVVLCTYFLCKGGGIENINFGGDTIGCLSQGWGPTVGPQGCQPLRNYETFTSQIIMNIDIFFLKPLTITFSDPRLMAMQHWVSRIIFMLFDFKCFRKLYCIHKNSNWQNWFSDSSNSNIRTSSIQ